MKRWFILGLGLTVWTGAGMLVCPDRGAAAGPSNGSDIDRIVCASPNLTEIAYFIGLGDKVVAVSDESDYPPEAALRRSIGSFWQPDIEAVIASRPDIVVTLDFRQQEALAERLDRIGYRTISVGINRIDDLFRAVEKIGRECGAAAESRACADRLKLRLSGLAGSPLGGQRLRVLWVVQIEPLRIAAGKSFINELIQTAGGINAAAHCPYRYPFISREQLIAWDPQVIIYPAADIRAGRRQLAALVERSPEVHAAQNGQFHCVPADIVSRIGPRICDGAELIRAILKDAAGLEKTRNPSTGSGGRDRIR